MMAVYAIGVPALAVLLFAVRPAKQKGGGHIDDQDEAVEEMVPGYFSQQNWIS